MRITTTTAEFFELATIYDEKEPEDLIGQQIVVYGLANQPALNGLVGSCLSYNKANDLFKVQIEGVGIAHLSPVNLRIMQ